MSAEQRAQPDTSRAIVRPNVVCINIIIKIQLDVTEEETHNQIAIGNQFFIRLILKLIVILFVFQVVEVRSDTAQNALPHPAAAYRK